MGDQQFQVFLTCGMILCAIMTIITLLRVRTRGPSAYCLALGFVTMGFLLNGFRQKWPAPMLALIGLAVLLCLAADFIVRSVRGQNSP